MVHEPCRFFDLLYSAEFEVCDARMVNENMIEVQYRNTEEFAEQNNKVNVVIAAFTTAYARLKLYDLLDVLQERVLYYDTDSVIYVHKPDEHDPPLGNYLGDLTDELNGDFILRLLSQGDLRITPTVQRMERRKLRYVVLPWIIQQRGNLITMLFVPLFIYM